MLKNVLMFVRSLKIETYMRFKYQIVDIPVWHVWHVVIRISIYTDYILRDIFLGVYFKFIKNDLATLSLGQNCRLMFSDIGKGPRILLQESNRLYK